MLKNGIRIDFCSLVMNMYRFVKNQAIKAGFVKNLFSIDFNGSNRQGVMDTLGPRERVAVVKNKDSKEKKMEAINLPKPQNEVKENKSMPLNGCRKLTPVKAYKYVNKYGIEKIHVDFSYNGYMFGQNFKVNSPLLYSLFNGIIDDTKLNTPLWAEILVDTGKITGKAYPQIVDVANEF